jgi:hypothetical protein
MGGGSVTQPQMPQAGTSPYYAPPDGSIQGAESYAMAEKMYQQALARFNQQRTGLLQQNGYAGSINPTTGMVGNIHVDTKSLFGNLQEMLHNQALEDQNAVYGAEDRNLVGGLANQAASELGYEHHGQTTALANTLLDNLSNIDSQQMDAKNALDMALWQLAQGAASSSPDNPADVGPDGPSSTGSIRSGFGTGGSAAQTMRQQNPGGYRQLAAVSAAMNARYGHHGRGNAYNTNKNKRG